MVSSTAEPDRAFRIGAWIWVGYLGAMALMDTFIYAMAPKEPVFWYYMVNSVPALAFLVLAHSGWLRTRSGVVTPVMILLASVAPIVLSHAFDLRLPQAPLANTEGMVLRQLPVLFIGLVLVAWRYSVPMMAGYCLATYLLDLALMSVTLPNDGQRFRVFFLVATIRMISLVVVGFFVNQLIARLREQQEALRAANLELLHHASTLENLAASRERNRLARELHDTLAHTLSGLAVQLETTKAYWSSEPETAFSLLLQSLTTTRSGLEETRRALKALRASPLEDLGLRLALQRLGESAAERGRLQLALFLPEEPLPLPPDVEQCIYRVAQEAVENVVRHAGARKLTVRLAVQGDELSLLVEDDGVGMDAGNAERAGHYGIAGMRERASLAGGTLSIEASPGQGTRLRLGLKGGRG